AQAANNLGVEGSALWLHLVSFADRMRTRGEMLGHALASVVPGVLIVAIGLLLQVIVRGQAVLLPAAAGVCLAALLGALGGACWLWAALPYAMPQGGTSVFASSVAGEKGRSAGTALAVLGIGAGTAAPAVAAAVAAVTSDPAWGWLGLLAGAGAGMAVLV